MIFLKKKGPKKQWEQMSVLPKKRAQWACKKWTKPIFRWSFHYEHNYEQGAKQEALKGHFNLKFALKKNAHKIGGTMGHLHDI